MTMLGGGAAKHAEATVGGDLAPAARPIKVMIVDDSAVVRGLVSRWVDEEPGLVTVARHPNSKLAVEDVAASEPDMILLDIEMPVMDGLAALPLLLRARPAVKMLVVSTLSRRNAEVSFTALSLGALDYVPKPSSNRDITLLPEFRSEVIRKIKALGGVRKAERPPRALEHESAIVHVRSANTRAFSLVPPRIIAIGSSTGGPQALAAVLGPLAPSLARVPVVVAQHMPATFIAVLAERFGRLTGREVREGNQSRYHLHRAGGPAHDRVGCERPKIALERRASGALLPPGSRSLVSECRGDLRTGCARRRAHRHGLHGRCRGLRGHAAARRDRIRGG
jgi:CheY-like chemotaxis protein